MAFKESRLKNGTLMLGPTGTGQMDVSCQLTNVRLLSNYDDDGDAITVLCGETLSPGRKSSGYQLGGTLVQDWDYAEAAGGVIDYIWNHELQIVAFEFTPNDVTTSVTMTGEVQLEMPNDSAIGGDVASRLTGDFTWNIQARPTITHGTLTQLEQATASA